MNSSSFSPFDSSPKIAPTASCISSVVLKSSLFSSITPLMGQNYHEIKN